MCSTTESQHGDPTSLSCRVGLPATRGSNKRRDEGKGITRNAIGNVGVIRSNIVARCGGDTRISRKEWRRTFWRQADQSNEMTAHGSTSHVSHGMNVNGKTSRGSIERDGTGHAGVTCMQSGVMAAIEKMACMASLNSNTKNVNSNMRGSGPDIV